MQALSPSNSRRLHPAGLVINLLSGIRRQGIGLIPLAVLVVRSDRAAFLIAAIAFFVYVAIVSPLIEFLRFHYTITADSLIIDEGGLFQKKRRVIPLMKVQSVDQVQKLRHRVFSVVQLNIEAVGSKSTEASLWALDLDEAERVRALVMKEGVVVQQAAGSEPLVALEPGQLVVAGATGGRVAVLAVLLSQFQQFLPEDRVDSISESLNSSLGSFGNQTVIVAAIAVTSFLLFSFLISIVATVLTYWGFKVSLEGDRLVVERGLLETRRSTIPLNRVQAVRIHQNIARRVLGLASISVVVAGYAGSSEEQKESGTLLPIGKLGDAERFATRVIGCPTELPGELVTSPPRSASMRLVTAVFVGGLLSVALRLFDLPPIAGLGATILLALHALAYRGSLGSKIGSEFAATRRGVLVRSTTLIPVPNIQHLRLRVGPLRKAVGLGDLIIYIPKAAPWASGLPRADADASFERLEREMIRGLGKVAAGHHLDQDGVKIDPG